MSLRRGIPQREQHTEAGQVHDPKTGQTFRVTIGGKPVGDPERVRPGARGARPHERDDGPSQDDAGAAPQDSPKEP